MFSKRMIDFFFADLINRKWQILSVIQINSKTELVHFLSSLEFNQDSNPIILSYVINVLFVIKNKHKRILLSITIFSL